MTYKINVFINFYGTNINTLNAYVPNFKSMAELISTQNVFQFSSIISWNTFSNLQTVNILKSAYRVLQNDVISD